MDVKREKSSMIEGGIYTEQGERIDDDEHTRTTSLSLDGVKVQ